MKRVLIAGGFAAAVILASGGLAAMAQNKPAAGPDIGHGEGLFDDMCVACHIKAGGGQGPSLVGVVGRTSATAPGVIYSKALQGAHLTWTPEQLDKFLADPAAAVPGTAMPMSVPDAKDRADLIAYLASPGNKP